MAITRPYNTNFRYCCTDVDGDVAYSNAATLLPLASLCSPAPYQQIDWLARYPEAPSDVIVTSDAQFATAVSNATAGTVIRMRPGTYTNLEVDGNGGPAANGTAANRITVVAEDGAVVQHAGYSGQAGGNKGYNISGVDFWDFVNLQVNTVGLGIEVGRSGFGTYVAGDACNDVRLLGGSVTNIGSAAVHMREGTNLDVFDMTISNVGNNVAGNGECIYYGYGSNVLEGYVRGGQVVGNVCTDFTANGIDIKGNTEFILVAYNTVTDGSVANGGAIMFGQGSQVNGNQVLGATNSSCMYNTVARWTSLTGDTVPGIGLQQDVDILHNVIHDGIDAGIRVRFDGPLTSINPRIQRNTMWNTETGVREETGPTAANPIYGCNLSNTNWSGAATPTATDITNATAGYFVNAGGGNFHLSSTSPAIDSGSVGCGMGTDPDGIGDQGTPDVGAYEYCA